MTNLFLYTLRKDAISCGESAMKSLSMRYRTAFFRELFSLYSLIAVFR